MHRITADILELRYPFEEELPVGTTLCNVVRDANLARVYDQAALRRLPETVPENNEFFIDNVTGVIRSATRVEFKALCADPAAIIDDNDNMPCFPQAAFDRPLVVEVLELAAVGRRIRYPTTRGA